MIIKDIQHQHCPPDTCVHAHMHPDTCEHISKHTHIHMYTGTPQYHTHIHMQNYSNKALLESLLRTIHPFKHYDGSKLSTYHEACSCSPHEASSRQTLLISGCTSWWWSALTLPLTFTLPLVLLPCLKVVTKSIQLLKSPKCVHFPN